MRHNRKRAQLSLKIQQRCMPLDTLEKTYMCLFSNVNLYVVRQASYFHFNFNEGIMMAPWIIPLNSIGIGCMVPS